MKKQLLLAMAFVATVFTVNAQGTYVIQPSDVITQDTEITSVDGAKLTFGPDIYTVKANASIDGGAVYVAYVSGAADPKDDAGLTFDKEGATTPIKGTFYSFAVSKNGTIDVAVVLNASKKFYVLEDGVALADFNGGVEAAKYYGIYTFPVKAGKTYTTFCTGSKLGFYGFTFNAVGTGISSTEAGKEVVATEYYNVIGMKLDEPAKGLNIVKNRMSDGSTDVSKAYIK